MAHTSCLVCLPLRVRRQTYVRVCVLGVDKSIRQTLAFLRVREEVGAAAFHTRRSHKLEGLAMAFFFVSFALHLERKATPHTQSRLLDRRGGRTCMGIAVERRPGPLKRPGHVKRKGEASFAWHVHALSMHSTLTLHINHTRTHYTGPPVRTGSRGLQRARKGWQRRRKTLGA